MFALAGNGGRLAGRIIAGQRQNAAQGRGAGKIAMTENVAGPVHPRPFAVPDAEDPVVTRALEQAQLLAAP